MLRLPLFCAAALLLGVSTPAVWSAPAPSFRFQAAPTDLAVKTLRRLGLLGKNATLTRPRLVEPPRPSGVQSRAIAQATTGPLQFNFVGYTNAQKAVLSNFLSANYARMVALWGVPAPEQAGKVVQIVGNEDFFAAYSPPASETSGGGTIFFKFDNSQSNAANTYILTRLVLTAFQGPRVPSFDFFEGRYVEPWLFGAADAAALQIAFQAQNSPANFDPSALGAYVLPVYDLLNRPQIGNAFIYPPDGNDLAISDFRLALAQAAFLKIYAQDATFFSRFNAALYARTPQARQNLRAADLEALAASVTPNVEGIPMRAWLRDQYALDARVTTGEKLYLAILPVPAALSGDTRSGFTGYAQAFKTEANGSESALSGQASVSVRDETGREVSIFSRELLESNVISFDDADAPGQALFGGGFTPWQNPAPALLQFKTRLRTVEADAYFPFASAGNVGSASSYYGGVIGVPSANLQLAQASRIQELTVERSVFSATLPYLSGPRVRTTLTINGQTQRRNTAWLRAGDDARSVAFLIEGASNSTTNALQIPASSSGLAMISFPIRPTARDEATALGIPANVLKLARFRTELSPSALENGVLKFGIAGDRHEIYPDISQPIQPGRGYWLGVSQSGFSTNVAGAQPSTSQPFEIPLIGGWNQVGTPFLRVFGSDSVKVRYGGFAPVALSVAQNRGWVARGVWKWLPQGGYQRIDVLNGVWKPWEGYWIFASPNRGVSLVFEPQIANLAMASSDGWSLPVVAQTHKTRDLGHFGVSTRIPAVKPPTGARAVTLSFAGIGTIAGSGLAEAFLPRLRAVNGWTFSVDGAQNGETVVLTLPNTQNAPNGFNWSLRDNRTRGETPFVSETKFSFQSDGKPREFTVIARLKPVLSAPTS